MTLSYDYWKDREEKARQQTIRDEKRHEEEIEEIYKRMFDEIQKDIDGFFAKYAADEGITIAEAKKRVSKLDMEEFERKAKKYVEEKDFSDQANEEMKLYNLTMKVNRLEMLKAKIGLELVNGYQEIEDYMGEALTETTMKEIERHAGILGKTVGDNQDYAEDIVDASFHNATWSERIWANQDRLKHDLGRLLTSGLIQGKNPRELARDLQKSMNVSKYDAERLMRTEMCRVQIDASLREIAENGFTQFIFIADSGGSRTCELCSALDGKTFALKDGKIGVNLPPIHPNCRCSIAGHEDDDDFINWLEEHGVELTDADLEAMGLSREDVGNTPDYGIEQFDKKRRPFYANEDLDLTNPKRGTGQEWDYNCQRAVCTYEARRRGRDVTAKPCYPNDKNDELPDMNSPNGWPHVFKIKDSDILQCIGDPKKVIEDKMNGFGEGSRGIVRIKYTDSFGDEHGHVFFVEHTHTGIQFIDPQTGNSNCESYFKKKLTDGETYLLRVDDKDFTDKIDECCTNRRKRK